MKHWTLALGAALTSLVAGYEGCDACTNNSTDPLVFVEAPWTLTGTVYSITILPSSTDLPTKAFPPLERGSKLETAGEYKGILGMIQIIRYDDSPVGPYDELLIVPGYFMYDRENEDGTTEEQTRVRVSRIYVSQKYTCWNGRLNWNIPKHLANFEWIEEDGKTTVKVYPYDTTGDPEESFPASKPWFQTTFELDILGGLPFSTDVYKWIGINATLAQPPLPEGNGSYGQLAGTDHWAATVPGQYSDDSWVGVFDMKQPDGGDTGDNGTNAVGDEYFENFWPGMGRYSIGLRMDNTTITFGSPEYWGYES